MKRSDNRFIECSFELQIFLYLNQTFIFLFFFFTHKIGKPVRGIEIA